MTPIVKICGLTTPEAVYAARDADYAGFIFYAPSPRNVTPEKAATLASNTSLKTVAVTVDAPDALLQAIMDTLKPSYLQLHGNETPTRLHEVKKKFGLPIIKAILIASAEDVTNADAYEGIADMLLFDARLPKGLPGGNGVTFDWKILAGSSFKTPWFLSGGLTVSNVEEALRISGAKMADVSSSLESGPGVKDSKLVEAFVKKVKSLSV